LPYATNSASTVKARWHNQKFAELADELRLDATKDSKIGWSPCTLRKDTSTTSKSVIADLKKGAHRLLAEGEITRGVCDSTVDPAE
jgi:hypothetical protein